MDPTPRTPARSLFILVAAVLLADAPIATGRACAQTPDGTLLFNDVTDTIRIDGQTELTTAATFEAWVFFRQGAAGDGRLYTEWKAFLEDKDLGVGPTFAFGFVAPASGDTILGYAAAFSIGTWHHFAFVHDSQAGVQRLYLDGGVIASKSISGQIANSDGPGTIGAIQRDGSVAESFRGLVDSVRLSNVARYGAESFTPPARDMPDDEGAVLVYHFDAGDFHVEDGKTRVTDVSGNDRDGTLGFGFDGSTSPAPPARQGDLDCNGELSAADALKNLRASVSAPVSQTEPCPDPREKLTTGLFGDVDCNGSLTAGDALKVLRVSVGLTAEQTLPCPEFLEPV
jgi:hypothetical protein